MVEGAGFRFCILPEILQPRQTHVSSSDQSSNSASAASSPASPSTASLESDVSASSLRIATRESPLAMWQAEHVAALLSGHGTQVEIVPMVSSGDIDMSPIDGRRSVGVFTKRIQRALLQDEGDVAVHSMKDLPTEKHAELVLASCPDREIVTDCLVSPAGLSLDQLRQGAVIGTGSRRRAAQLKRVRPDLDIQPIRGNVQTRLKKMSDGQYDAIILAAAGIERLEMHDLPRVELPLDIMLPAPGQGALAIEVRRDDQAAFQQVALTSDPASMACTLAERTLLAALHGGCLAPIAALGTIETHEASGSSLNLIARVLSTDGTQQLEVQGKCEIDLDDRDPATGSVHQAAQLGLQLSQQLIEQGAKELIHDGRSE